MISTSLTVFSVLQETMPVLPIHLGLLDQMGLEGDDEPSIMLIKKIPSDENRSESEVRGNPKFPPRCPQFQSRRKHQQKQKKPYLPQGKAADNTNLHLGILLTTMCLGAERQEKRTRLSWLDSFLEISRQEYLQTS